LGETISYGDATVDRMVRRGSFPFEEEEDDEAGRGGEGVKAMATILVVDDDRQVCALLKQVLEEQGYTVESALNGIEGMKAYQSHPVDLILLDILMPEKEGLETILDLRREFPKVKIIAMSGGSERAKLNLLDLARRLGAQYTVNKPFQLETITDLVKKALQEH
jgi:CheY-like chemotaxis protein